jgi:hypothetical protein
MVNNIVVMTLLLFSVNSYAMGGAERRRDYYERSVKKAKQYIYQTQKSRCSEQINNYRRKLYRNPRNEYYKYQLELWKYRCR